MVAVEMRDRKDVDVVPLGRRKFVADCLGEVDPQIRRVLGIVLVALAASGPLLGPRPN